MPLWLLYYSLLLFENDLLGNYLALWNGWKEEQMRKELSSSKAFSVQSNNMKPELGLKLPLHFFPGKGCSETSLPESCEVKCRVKWREKGEVTLNVEWQSKAGQISDIILFEPPSLKIPLEIKAKKMILNCRQEYGMRTEV